MKIFPAVHYSMGGLWVDYNQHTNIKGLFAAGECDYSQHGANRLGANSLLSAIYGGMVAGPNVVEYISGLKKSSGDVSQHFFETERKKREDQYANILKLDGTENPYQIHRELGQWMTDNVTVVRYNDRLKKTDDKILELMERWKRIGMADKSNWENMMAPFTRQLWNMLELARVVTLGALNRDESRGAHYKPDFPERDDENFLKTTIAAWTPDGPSFQYEDVDVSLIKPRLRNYSVDKEASK
jgi:succinate dehydrogenase / fumarate reductase flavoprotein subunit